MRRCNHNTRTDVSKASNEIPPEQIANSDVISIVIIWSRDFDS